MPERDGLEPIDALFCALLEGSASDEQKQEFLLLAESDPRTKGQSELLLRLRLAVLSPHELDLDVLQEFMGVLSAGDGWDDFADSLRSEASHLGKEPGSDLTDSIMANVDEQGLLVSRLFDGELSTEERKSVAEGLGSNENVLLELSQHATLGRMIREAVGDQSRLQDLSGVWSAVAQQIGMPDPEHVPGWAPIGEALAAVVAEHGRLDADVGSAMTSTIMERVEDYSLRMSKATSSSTKRRSSWFRWGIPTFAVAAAAAALLVSPMFGNTVSEHRDEAPEFSETEDGFEIQYAERDEVEIEELDFADDVFVQVMADEEDAGGPVIIMIDENVEPIEMDDEEGIWDTGGEPI